MYSSGIALHPTKRPFAPVLCQLPEVSEVSSYLSKGVALQGGFAATLESVALHGATIGWGQTK